MDGAPVFDVHAKFSAPPGDRTDMDCAVHEGLIDEADAYFSTLMRPVRFRVSGDRLEILLAIDDPACPGQKDLNVRAANDHHVFSKCCVRLLP